MGFIATVSNMKSRGGLPGAPFGIDGAPSMPTYAPFDLSTQIGSATSIAGSLRPRPQRVGRSQVPVGYAGGHNDIVASTY